RCQRSPKTAVKAMPIVSARPTKPGDRARKLGVTRERQVTWRTKRGQKKQKKVSQSAISFASPATRSVVLHSVHPPYLAAPGRFAAPFLSFSSGLSPDRLFISRTRGN